MTAKVTPPTHPKHVTPMTPLGLAPKEGEFINVVGNFIGVDYGRKAMGIDWMVRTELRQAIPPAYTEFIGAALMRIMKGDSAASGA